MNCAVCGRPGEPSRRFCSKHWALVPITQRIGLAAHQHDERSVSDAAAAVARIEVLRKGELAR